MFLANKVKEHIGRYLAQKHEKNRLMSLYIDEKVYKIFNL